MNLITQAGIYQDIPNLIYQASPGISNSQIKLCDKSPLAYHRKYILGIDDDEGKQYFAEGDLIHCLVLDPHTVEERFVIVDKFARRSKDDKARWAEMEQQAERETKRIVWTEDYERCLEIAQAVRAHPEAGRILERGVPELSIFHQIEVDGRTIMAKVRMDWVTTGGYYDLKSARDASIGAFSRAIEALGYHIQAAYYLDTANAALEESIEEFTFIVVEKEPPYHVAIYPLAQRAIEAGRMEYKTMLERLVWFLHNDWWPGYNDDQVIEIDLPGYAYTKIANKLEALTN